MQEYTPQADSCVIYSAPCFTFGDHRVSYNVPSCRYDSSISESFPSTTSPSATNLLWPYTMDYGIPQVGLSMYLLQAALAGARPIAMYQ